MSGEIKFTYTIPVKIDATDKYVGLFAEDRFFVYSERLLRRLDSTNLEPINKAPIEDFGWINFLLDESTRYSSENMKLFEPDEKEAYGGWGLVVAAVKCLIIHLPVKWWIGRIKKGEDKNILLAWRRDKHPGRGIIVTPKQLENIWKERVKLKGKTITLKIEYKRPMLGYVILSIKR